MSDERPTYHDLHVTASGLARTSIFDLPYGVEVRCNRVAGWEVWVHPDFGKPRLVGGEYGGAFDWLVLDVAGHVICDSRPDDSPPSDGAPTR